MQIVNKLFTRLIGVFLTTTLIIGSVSLLPIHAAETQGIKIICTSDIHSIDETNISMSTDLTEYVNSQRELGYKVVLIDGGDLFTDPDSQKALNHIANNSNMNRIIRKINDLQYDYIVPGNHEFIKYGKLSDTDDTVNKKATIFENSILYNAFSRDDGDIINYEPTLVLSTNINFSNSNGGKSFFMDHGTKIGIINYNGQKIGLLGFTTSRSKVTSNKNAASDLEFTLNPTQIQNEISSLKNDGVTKIIAISHLENNSKRGTHELDDLQKISEIDAIISGHNHPTDIASNNSSAPTITKTPIGAQLCQLHTSSLRYITEVNIDNTGKMDLKNLDKNDLIKQTKEAKDKIDQLKKAQSQNNVASSSKNTQSSEKSVYDINKENVELNGGGTYTINGDGSPTNNKIIIKGNNDGENPLKYDITLNNINIDTKNEYGIWIQEGADINLTFKGKNITSSPSKYDWRNDGQLIIKGSTGNDSSLEIKGIAIVDDMSTMGNIIIEGGKITIESGIESYSTTINGGSLTILSDNPIHVMWGKLFIKGGNINLDKWDKKNINSIPSILYKSNNEDTIIITGGTINGVSYPLSGSASFDKELSDDKDTTSSEKTPHTGYNSEINLVLISTFLGLVLVTGITLNRTRKFN